MTHQIRLRNSSKIPPIQCQREMLLKHYWQAVLDPSCSCDSVLFHSQFQPIMWSSSATHHIPRVCVCAQLDSQESMWLWPTGSVAAPVLLGHVLGSWSRLRLGKELHLVMDSSMKITEVHPSTARPHDEVMEK